MNFFLKIIKYLKDSSLHFIYLRFYKIISNQRKMAFVLGNGMFTGGILSIEIDIKIEINETIKIVLNFFLHHCDDFFIFIKNRLFSFPLLSSRNAIADRLSCPPFLFIYLSLLFIRFFAFY